MGRLQCVNEVHAASATSQGRGAGFRSQLYILNETIEIPTLREVLCRPERQREEQEKVWAERCGNERGLIPSE